jgi:BirA family transcriptional regulator, biotin operon repressor / biotin---[acetyl-CoA-carboxylase] ligase
MKSTPSPIQWQTEALDQTDSTNRVAADRVRACWDRGQSAEGLVILAARQTAGRGQHGRTWESPPGGLYLSAVVENVPMDGGVRERLALLAGVAVAQAFDALTGAPAAQIRWPNDLMLADKKVAGILCEALAQGTRWAAIIGIGVNVSTPVRDLPPNLQATATSLQDFDGQSRTPRRVAEAILSRLNFWLPQLHCGLSPIIELVRERDALIGRRLRFASGGDVFDATAAGIDDQGRLLLRRDHGNVQPHATGSVRSVAPIRKS